MGEPTPRTADQLFSSILSRLTGLERRMGKTVLPERLSGVKTAILDANLAVDSGSYWLSSGGLNKPTTGTHWHIDVLAIGTGSVYQEAKLIGTGFYEERWVRAYIGSSWSAWRLLDRGTTSFTPTIVTGITLGNGTVSGRYAVANGILNGRIRLVFGSTTALSVSGDLVFGHPYPIGDFGFTSLDGDGRLNAGTAFNAAILINATGIFVRAIRLGGEGNQFPTQVQVTPTVPATWGSGHAIEIAFTYPI